MDMLAQDPKTIFLGQGIRYPGHAMYETVKQISDDRKIEMPVAEDLQMGISIGLSLAGYIPVSIYPRMDFLLCAMNQLVNHLDKIEDMSRGQYKPFVIIRTMKGSTDPLDPGLQHKGDYTDMLKIATNRVIVFKLRHSEDIFETYKWAYDFRKSVILIELP